MQKNTPTVPKLRPLSQHFKLGTNKIPVEAASTENFREVFCMEPKPPKISYIHHNLLNFPNSQQCYVVGKDNSVFKANPIKCVNSPRYLKP